MSLQTKNKTPDNFRLLLLLSAILTLGACSKDLSDLEAYRDETLARPGGRIDPLPQIKPYEGFIYAAQNRRAPFEPEVQIATQNSDGPDGPDASRKREYLEEFPLDSLRMVGTLNMRGGLVALVQDPEGLIHQVKVGNYAGQNHGRVVALDDSEVKIVEIISDGLGGWLERPAAIALSD